MGGERTGGGGGGAATWAMRAALAAAGSAAIALLVSTNGEWPAGSDTMFHVYRGDLLYRSIASGQGWPFYDRMWYNGVDIMRQWPPGAAIVHAAIEAACGGDPFAAYIGTLIAAYLAGLATWFAIGSYRGRPMLGAAIGALWPFIPSNANCAFGEGNLPRMFIMAIFPIAIFAVQRFLATGAASMLVHVWAVALACTLFHVGYAAMLLIPMAFWLLIRCAGQGGWKDAGYALGAYIAGILSAGPVAVPSALGGGGAGSADVAAGFFQPLWRTLDPTWRIMEGKEGFYFGLVPFTICILGILASPKRTAPLFAGAAATVLATTQPAGEMAARLPGGGMLWMLRLLPAASAMMLMGLLYWPRLKRWALAAAMCLLALDCAPSVMWLWGERGGPAPQERLAAMQEGTLLGLAQGMCCQRIALMDLSSLGAEGAYATSAFGSGRMAVFGAGWEGAGTARNISRLNLAMQEGCFPYMFDRLLQLGADTAVIRKAMVPEGGKGLARMDAAAGAAGYAVAAENGGYILYHRDTGGTFGTRAAYGAIGIGESAWELSLTFPDIEEAADPCLDHYRLDALMGYRAVYLAGFRYESKAAAEDMVRQLSEAGTRVCILADSIPEEEGTGIRSFLEVSCAMVTHRSFPALDAGGIGLGILDGGPLPEGMDDGWRAAALVGLGEETCRTAGGELPLAACGTGINSNVRYVGLNIPYYHHLTKDKGLEGVMAWALGMEPGRMPERELVPLAFSFSARGFSVTAPEGGACTGMAALRCLSADRPFGDENGLLCAGEGTTSFRAGIPFFWHGAVTGIAGLAMAAALHAGAAAKEKEGKGRRA